MIPMKALRPGNMGPYVSPRKRAFVSRAREFLAESEHRARELESEGLAYRVSPPAPPSQVMAQIPAPNPAAAAGPFVSPGGETGAAAVAPSSHPDHQPRRRRSQR